MGRSGVELPGALRRIVRTLLVVVGLVFVADRAPADDARPNILWIVGENLALDLGCYGEEHVRTPHLDRLAKEGVRYTRVYATSPVCAPSRSCFLTGWYQTSTDTHNMRSHRDDDFRLPAVARPLTHSLRDAGYLTANVKTIGDRVVGTGKLDLNFVNEGPIYETDDWSKLKSSGKPFFATINMPEAEYDIYDRKSAEKGRVKWVGEEWHPKVATPENVTPPPYYPDHPLVREEWARYLNSVSGIDVRVGGILEALAKDGLADDTIIVFFGDNGRLDARGIHWCFDSGLHVPMIVHWPRNHEPPKHYEAGTVDERIISLLDLTATTLVMAGLEPPLLMQSQPFLGDRVARRSFAFAARDRIDETVVRLRSVHDERYHYVRNFTPGAGFPTLNRYKEKCFPVKPLMRELFAAGKLTGPPAELMQPFPPEMLFDTRDDPHEIRNLAESEEPEHRAALRRLRAALDTWIVETNDRGRWLEPPEVVAPFEKEMHDWFGTPDWYRRKP